MLKFTPAIGERKYDWEKNQVISIAVLIYIVLIFILFTFQITK